jgi:CheY-like chemotaxis protein
MVGIEAEKLDPTKLAPRRILIVDDYPNTAESFARLLRHLGHEVEVAFDGVQAIEIAERCRPEIVLLDIGMPKMNGYETAEWIRRQPWGKQTRLIALTGWQGEEHRQRSLKSGFDAHLVKPVGPTEILTLLVNLLALDVAPT